MLPSNTGPSVIHYSFISGLCVVGVDGNVVFWNLKLYSELYFWPIRGRKIERLTYSTRPETDKNGLFGGTEFELGGKARGSIQWFCKKKMRAMWSRDGWVPCGSHVISIAFIFTNPQVEAVLVGSYGEYIENRVWRWR